MALWAYTLRALGRRPGRTLLTALGIAAGVATVVGTALTADAARRSYRDLFDGVTGPAALEVSAPGGAGFDPAPLAWLRAVPGVAAVSPRAQGVAALRGKSPVPVPVLVQGLDSSDRAAAGLSPCDGQAPAADGEALLDAGLADAESLCVGNHVRLWCPTGPAELVVVGRSPPRGATGLPAAVVPLATAQRLFALGGRVTALHLFLSEGATGDPVAAEIARRLPPGLAVHRGGLPAGAADATRLAAERGLAAVSAAALVVAAFVALNAFLLNVTESRAELALLHSLGATRGQLRRLLLRQAVVTGAVGALAGAAAGYCLAVLLLGLMARFLGVPASSPHFGAGALLALALGPATAVAAALLPACRPGGDAACAGDAGERLPRWLVGAGLLLAAVAGLSLSAACRGASPAAGSALLAPALGALLAGAALAFAALLPALLRQAARRLAPRLGVEGGLALRQLARRPARAALTGGTLFVVTVLAVGAGHALLNTLDDLRRWCRAAVPADFLVRGSEPDAAFLLATALPEALGDELAAQAAVAAVDRVAFLHVRAAGREALVLARTFRAEGPLPLDLRDGDPADVRTRLLRGEAVIGTGLAREAGLLPGDTLTLETPGGPRTLRVAATAAEYAGGGRALYLEWEAARRLLTPTGVHAFLVTARPGRSAEAGAALRDCCARRGLLLQANDDFRRLLDRMLARVAAALWAVVATALAVAALGLANILWMNVREQTREIGVLRALGMTRPRVARVVLCQALWLAAASLPPGLLAGAGLGYAINAALRGLFGHTASFRPEWGLSAGVGLTALAATLAAALVPARRAARLRVVRALGGG